MSINNQRKLAQHIFRLLRINYIIFPIGRTPRGEFGIKFSDNSDDFEMYLDAVPLSTKDMLEDDNNIELKKMIEKYWFEQSPIRPIVESVGFVEVLASNTVPAPIEPPKKKGRPKGSKNKQISHEKEKKDTVQSETVA